MDEIEWFTGIYVRAVYQEHEAVVDFLKMRATGTGDGEYSRARLAKQLSEYSQVFWREMDIASGIRNNSRDFRCEICDRPTCGMALPIYRVPTT